MAFALTSSTAQAITGNEMLADLQRNDISYEYGYSTGLIAGVYETSQRFQGKYLCIPEGVSNKQIIDVVKASLISNPEKRHMDASYLVYMILAKSWPCLQNNPAIKSR